MKTFETQFDSLQKMFTSRDTNYSSHNLHDYPAKFIPQYPNLFINYFSKPGMNILDPMCGSGTTLIESAILNRHGYGYDIDPIAFLSSKVSTTPIKPEMMDENYKHLLQNIKKKFDMFDEIKADINLPSPDEYPNLDIWFQEDVFKELLILKEEILAIEDYDYKDFAKLCLSSIIKSVSNADPRDIFPERDLQKPVRERKNVFNTFKNALDEKTEKIKDFSKKVNFIKKVSVVNGDSRSLQLDNDSIDLVVTSPPYAFAIDYARVFKLSTLLLVSNNEELKALSKQYVGTDHISKKDDLENFTGIEFLEDKLRLLHDANAKSKRIAIILYKYFRDLHQITAELNRTLKASSSSDRSDGGYLIYIIGDSTIRKTEFKTSEFLTEIVKYNGFSIEAVLKRPYYAHRMARKRAKQSNLITNDIFIIAKKESSISGHTSM